MCLWSDNKWGEFNAFASPLIGGLNVDLQPEAREPFHLTVAVAHMLAQDYL